MVASRTYTASVLFIIILVCVTACSTHNTGFSQAISPTENVISESAHTVPNVRYVDSVGRNFLFRGAHPVIEITGKPAEFDYEALRTAIENAGRDAGQDIPSRFTLIDVSLLWVENPQDHNRERALVLAENAFFAAHPELGQLHMWPIQGTRLDPADLSIATHRQYLAKNPDYWLSDSLVSRVATLRKWMENPSVLGVTGPVVIYVHCFGGCDRTGELVGSYYLRYMNMTWEAVRTLNAGHCRPDHDYDKNNCNALQWYGVWLNQEYGRSLNWDADHPCYRRSRF
jgi:hypothetical protein